ncbi:hypothetical protein DFR39_103271 [Roseateles asaccharophilus]|uniref:Tetratricopeptide repeat protein n=2 Tax=Roseateles asaccharophilus TaxID=582607 RepID=A0A4R6N7Y6_9BURK|nr:hypothetical protein DFR39_103271 [Roseateles asaccharophilus]
MAHEPMDTQIEQAWSLHAEQPEAAAALLRPLAAELACASAEQQQAWLRAAEHVLLGHLADGAALAALIAALPAEQTRRAHAALALAAHPRAERDWQDLPPAERVRASYNAVLALSRRRDFDAMRALMDAAQALVGADAQAARAWAAMANNVAADLRFYLAEGDAEAAAAMVDAAQRARSAWQQAGGWLEAERADWQLAMCAAAAGQGALALQAAQDCVSACLSNEADDYEHCFAYEALGRAAVAAGDGALARQAHARMAERLLSLAGADRSYADSCLLALESLIARLKA